MKIHASSSLVLVIALSLLILLPACYNRQAEANKYPSSTEKPVASNVPINNKSLKPVAEMAKKEDRRRVEMERQKLMAGTAGSAIASPEPAPMDEESSGEFGYSDEGDTDPQFSDYNTEAYAHIQENDFTSPNVEPLSTFSIDVDVASYANVRRFLNSSQMPYPGAVRIEEMINYFSYDYPQPIGKHPFSITTELGACPWNADHHLVHIGLQGKNIDRSELPASNLVFLMDVSGSMNNPNKLPLLKQAFKMLINNLSEEDRVAIVVYAGAAGQVLPSTSASKRSTILEALDELEAGGSTAGGAGIQLAYKVAKENFIKGGNNRVILATDGDFNIGASSESELVRMIEEKRKDGVFLSVLGFGTGNYQDSKMEQLADKGNGNYAYIDNILEAKKVLVKEMGGTLFTIAKDVKIQIEFNPALVKGYRLIGYENRVLAAQDFNDDTKDAGELGAGHTVTAIYEVVPTGSDTKVASIDELKYQKAYPQNASLEGELMTVKFRYKQPDGDTSTKIEQTLDADMGILRTSENFRFSAAVASFGMILRGSKYKGTADYDQVLSLAKDATGDDPNGYRAEFVQLVKKASMIDDRKVETTAKRE